MDECTNEDPEPASPTLQEPQDAQRKKTSKRTADVKWTQSMRDKLVQQVYMMKAYKRTQQTQQEKYTAIQKVLEADRDFAEVTGTGKGWEAFKSQFELS